VRHGHRRAPRHAVRLSRERYLTPVSGAIGQEVIDVLAVLNALRAAFPPAVIHDF